MCLAQGPQRSDAGEAVKIHNRDDQKPRGSFTLINVHSTYK